MSTPKRFCTACRKWTNHDEMGHQLNESISKRAAAAEQHRNSQVKTLREQLRTERERTRKLAQLIWKTRWVSEDGDYQDLVGMAAEIESGHFTALDTALSHSGKEGV